MRKTTGMPFVAIYGRLHLDRGRVDLLDICFGGIADTYRQAEDLARDCVRTETKPGRGLTILPRVYELSGECDLFDKMEQCREYLEELVSDMNEVSERTRRKS